MMHWLRRLFRNPFRRKPRLLITPEILAEFRAVREMRGNFRTTSSSRTEETP